MSFGWHLIYGKVHILSVIVSNTSQLSHVRSFCQFKNPKALLFAAGIFPPETWESLYNTVHVFILFSLILLPVAFFWMCFGRALLAGNVRGVRAEHLYKGSALLLVVCMLPVILDSFKRLFCKVWRLFRYFWRTNPITPGKILKIIMPKIKCVKLSLTTGILPNKYPSVINEPIHKRHPRRYNLGKICNSYCLRLLQTAQRFEQTE